MLRFQISTADFTKPSGCHNSVEPWRGPLRRFQVNSGTTGRSAYATAAVARCSNGGVIILFRRLSWDYKTNQPFQFGKRIILNCLLSVYGNDTAHAFLNHTTTDQPGRASTSPYAGSAKAAVISPSNAPTWWMSRMTSSRATARTRSRHRVKSTRPLRSRTCTAGLFFWPSSSQPDATLQLGVAQRRARTARPLARTEGLVTTLHCRSPPAASAKARLRSTRAGGVT